MPIRMIAGAVLPIQIYEAVAANLAGPVSNADGFMFHTAERTPDGVKVTEIWASEEQFRQFYDHYVRPNLQEGTPEPAITELHNTLTPSTT